MSQETKRKGLNWEIVSLLFILSWIVLGNRSMTVDFIPQNAWFWLNTIIGFVGLFIVFGILIYRLIKGWRKKPTETKTSDKEEPPRINIKVDAADIAKMNPKQLAVFKELLSKMPDQKPKE